jgi:hypothetical protein
VLSVNSEIAVIIMVKMRFNMRISLFCGICPLIDNYFKDINENELEKSTSLCILVSSPISDHNTKVGQIWNAHALMNNMYAYDFLGCRNSELASIAKYTFLTCINSNSNSSAQHIDFHTSWLGEKCMDSIDEICTVRFTV